MKFELTSEQKALIADRLIQQAKRHPLGTVDIMAIRNHVMTELFSEYHEILKTLVISTHWARVDHRTYRFCRSNKNDIKS